MLRGSQNGKRCSKGTELLKGAEAALSLVTRGKFDNCSIQEVSGRTGHALWQIAPSSSLPPPTLHRQAQMALLPEKKSVPSAGAGENDGHGPGQEQTLVKVSLPPAAAW